MPVPNQPETAHEALIRVCNELDRSGTDGSREDFEFIRNILQDVVVDCMFQAHERLQKPVDPADHDATGAVNQLLDLLESGNDDPESRELFNLLADPDLQAVLHAHDDIAKRSFEPVIYPDEPAPGSYPADSAPADGEAIRMIGVRRKPGEPLGITVGNEGGSDQLTVVRIAPNSVTEKQGLIQVGDIILEINKVPVHTPEELGDVIRRSGNDIQFKVIPGAKVMKGQSNQRFLRTHFSYDPLKDQKQSTPALGLPFSDGDILAVLKDEDKNWWECKNLSSAKEGLIPSPEFEERRRTIAPPPPDKEKSSLLCGMGKKKKKYTVNSSATAQDSPAVLYEEVIRVKPFRHKCLVLVGAQGIGRRSIKNRIIQQKPQSFGAPIPNTSRPMREGEIAGRSYHFLSRDDMDSDIKAGKYLEYGELRGNYYGTSFSALQSIISSGKTCIVDPKSAALSKLRNTEWMPYVIFVKPTTFEALRQMNLEAINDGIDTAKKTDEEIRRMLDESQRIQRQFKHYFDVTIPYDNFDATSSRILDLFDKSNSRPQWVPASWASACEILPYENQL